MKAHKLLDNDPTKMCTIIKNQSLTMTPRKYVFFMAEKRILIAYNYRQENTTHPIASMRHELVLYWRDPLRPRKSCRYRSGSRTSQFTSSVHEQHSREHHMNKSRVQYMSSARKRGRKGGWRKKDETGTLPARSAREARSKGRGWRRRAGAPPPAACHQTAPAASACARVRRYSRRLGIYPGLGRSGREPGRREKGRSGPASAPGT